jgi:hypothetical protein
MEETKSEITYNFEEFKKQLNSYLKSNYRCYSQLLDEISEATNEEALKRVLKNYNDEIFEFLGGTPIDEDEIEELENDIRNLKNELGELESKLEDLEDLTDGTLVGEYKYQHFIKYKDEYTEWELEELLENGKKYLNK